MSQLSNFKGKASKAALNTKSDFGLTNAVAGSLKSTETRIDNDRMRTKDKADRATVENCLDPRTMREIDKMLANKKLDQFSGCISTGKEANVYLATGTMDIAKRETFPADENGNIPVKEYAVKVFKTSILVFKDRERYVSGEFRFRNGHCKGNPRKMVGLWAEKEVRNLKRIGLTEGLIKVPNPHILKNNIIVMDFVGENGVPAPRLRDAGVDDWRGIYD
jgi:RIO kinase 1